LARSTRRGSQAFRLSLLTLPLLIPAFSFYPDHRAVREAGEGRDGREPVRHLKSATSGPKCVIRFKGAARRSTRFRGCSTSSRQRRRPIPTRKRIGAFRVWQTTALARYPITSSVELYGPDGRLVSRFAFNLPEDLTATAPSEERSCDWDVFEEVAPFFAEERRVLHAGRAFCAADPKAPPLGSIVVHAMPDYENLTFISSRSPYMELLRGNDAMKSEGLSGRDIEFAVYGWSRTPLYPAVASAWSLTDDVFARVEESRTPFWTTLSRGPDEYDVYLLNDRGGIYALGFPAISALGHLVNLAELTVLAMTVYVLLLVANTIYRWLDAGRSRAGAAARSARELLSKALPRVRARRHRSRRRARAGHTELRRRSSGAQHRTGSRANRIGRGPRRRGSGRAARGAAGARRGRQPDGVGQPADRSGREHVHGPASAGDQRAQPVCVGLLPTRTPSEVYRALELRNEAALVTREHIGTFEYLVAATPLTLRQLGSSPCR
jgi:hypothetical protein